MFCFQGEDGIRDFCLSRGLGGVYKGQEGEEACLVLVVTVARLEKSQVSPLAQQATPARDSKNHKNLFRNVLWCLFFSGTDFDTSHQNSKEIL